MMEEELKIVTKSDSNRSEMTEYLAISIDENCEETCQEELTDRSKYRPLLKAVLQGSWEDTEMFLKLHPDALSAGITQFSQTALHVAVARGTNIKYVKKLVDMVSPEQLAMANDCYSTVLGEAAAVGNMEAAKLLVEKNPNLPGNPDRNGYIPLYWAVSLGHRKMVLYLLSLSGYNIGHGERELEILSDIIAAEFYDIALNLIAHNPGLVSLASYNHGSPLLFLAGHPYAFLSGSKLNTLQRIIYNAIPLKLESFPSSQLRGGDTENTNSQELEHNTFRSQLFKRRPSEWLKAICWEVIETAVPSIKHIKKLKVKHHESLQLVKCWCKKIESLELSETPIIVQEAINSAAEHGIHEIVVEIAESVPVSLLRWTDQYYSAFKISIFNRQENVFNHIFQMNGNRRIRCQLVDEEDEMNNILHLAGKLAPRNQLNRISGAALQMQRELQWFKEVENIVEPFFLKCRNSDKKTPRMLFSEEHTKLVEDGEKWLKDNANSCTIAAALIATVVFAAAITVPGGYDSTNGLPILGHETSFILFAISDTISLFSSTVSVLIFLSILTARCAEDDFLYALPHRLICGQVTLFLSITSMMIAFSSIVYLLFGKNQPWILILVCISASLSVTLYATLQFPLLVTTMKSTYGPSIFGKKNNQ